MLKKQLEEMQERNDLPEKKVPNHEPTRQKEIEALISKTYQTGSKGNKFNKTGTGRLNKVPPSKAENKMIMTY